MLSEGMNKKQKKNCQKKGDSNFDMELESQLTLWCDHENVQWKKKDVM